jgi:hypothetical protein
LNSHACVWTDISQNPTNLSPNLNSACANGINDAGLIVGKMGHAVKWTAPTAESRVDLYSLGGNNSYSSNAMSVNNAGQIVGLSDQPGGPIRACIWNSGQLTPDILADLPLNTFALAINNQGNVAGQYFEKSLQYNPCAVFYWDHLTLDLQLFIRENPGNFFNGLSDSNQLIFSFWWGVSSWTPTSGQQDLNTLVMNLPPGVTLREVNAISPQKGYIVGRDSQWKVCLLTPISAPPALPGLNLLLLD